MAIGNRVEPLDSLGPRLDVELDVSAGAMLPWLARHAILCAARNWGRRGRRSRPLRLAAHNAEA
jgi:hypothetical protein